MLLTIAIPTLNRSKLLAYTIENLIEQLNDLELNQVEFLVINNGSTDNTHIELEKIKLKYPIIKVFNFTEVVPLSTNFKRCIELSTGKYIWLFGDDDMLIPGSLKYLFSYIASEKYGIIYMNRVKIDLFANSFQGVVHNNNGVFTPVEMTNRNLIEAFNSSLSFITSMIFQKAVWNEGVNKFDERYGDGYKYLACLLFGGKEYLHLYIPIPMVFQRMGIQTWIKDWPRYWLNHIPNLFYDLDRESITTGLLKRWKMDLGRFELFKTLVLAKAFEYKISDEFWVQTKLYFEIKDRFVISFVRYLFPSILIKLLYRTFSKKYKK